MLPFKGGYKLSLLVMFFLAAGVGGCGRMDYAFSAVTGQLELLVSAIPIEDALDDPDLTAEEKEKLSFIVRARDYAEQVIGLKAGRSYQRFADLDAALAWNLSASHKAALEPYYWDIPFVGPLPYLGFFELEEAEEEARKLADMGYDTIIYEVDAYSTMGWMPDPIASPLLDRGWVSLADTIFHELLHNTVWKDGHITFNESMAVFVGRAAALEFIALEFGPDSPLLEEGRFSYEDEDRFQEFLLDLKAELIAIYSSSMTREKKILEREEAFENARQEFTAEVLPLMNFPENYENFENLPLNNAFILLNARYNTNTQLFAAIHHMTGEDWSITMDIFRDAVAAEDPFGFLESMLEE
jgi:predicted aminopeptidase